MQGDAMRDQIVEKLRAILTDAIDSECKVVYFLAECRKLLEKYPPFPVPVALKMYCHWALHIDLTNPTTTFTFLEQVDRYAQSVLAGNRDIVAEHQMFREFIWLETFRGQLRDFLRSYTLPTALCDEDGRWHEFLKHYGAVVEDGSLACTAGKKARRLQLVKQVNVTKGGPQPAWRKNTVAPFELDWEIDLQDGRSLAVTVYAAPMPNGDEMLVHGIKIRGIPALNAIP